MKDAVIEIVHHIPGRVRLRASAAKSNPAVAAGLEAAATSLDGVIDVSVNTASGTALILFDSAETSAANIRDHLSRGWASPSPADMLRAQLTPKGGLSKARKRRNKVVRHVLEVVAGIVIERGLEIAIRVALRR
jgi:hypothetical protein